MDVSLPEVARAVTALLDARPAGKALDPAEAARRVAGTHWEEAMPAVRAVCAEMAARGEIVVTQRGLTVDPRTVRGTFHIKRAG